MDYLYTLQIKGMTITKKDQFSLKVENYKIRIITYMKKYVFLFLEKYNL